MPLPNDEGGNGKGKEQITGGSTGGTSYIPIDRSLALSQMPGFRDEAEKEYREQYAQLTKQRQDVASKLTSAGVIFENGKPARIRVTDPSGEPVIVDIESAYATGNMPSDVYQYIQDYNAISDDLKWLDTVYEDFAKQQAKTSSAASDAVSEFLRQEKAFRERVKFYIDAASDIADLRQQEIETETKGLEHNKKTLDYVEKVGIPLPGMSFYVRDMGPSMTTIAKQAAGFPVGNVTGRYEHPDEWAAAAGIPGYARGTQMAKEEQKGKRGVAKFVGPTKGRAGISAYAKRVASGPRSPLGLTGATSTSSAVGKMQTPKLGARPSMPTMRPMQAPGNQVVPPGPSVNAPQFMANNPIVQSRFGNPTGVSPARSADEMTDLLKKLASRGPNARRYA